MFRKDELYQKLLTKEPFCFLKINDGECNALRGCGNDLSRGDEKSTTLMCNELRQAVSYRAQNYFVGRPCSFCDEKNFQIFKSFSKTSNDEKFLSNIFINSNYEDSCAIFQQAFQHWKHIVILLNDTIPQENQDELLDYLHLQKTQVEFKYVTDKYCFDPYFEKYHDYGDIVPTESLCLFLCGPLGRVLAKRWYESNNSLTCLELGSFFDPILRKKCYLYQNGSLPYCKGCNPIRKQKPSSIVIENEPLDHECIYIYQLQQMLQYYQYDYHAVFNNCTHLSAKMPDMNLWKELVEIATDKINKTKEIALTFQHTIVKYEPCLSPPKETSILFQLFVFIHDSSCFSDTLFALGNAGLLNDRNQKGLVIGCISKDWETLQQELRPYFMHQITVIPFEEEMEFYQHIQKAATLPFLYYHTALQSALQRDYLQHFVMTHYKTCLMKLQYYDVVGCNYYSFDDDLVEKPFCFQYATPVYSGNCFWCTLPYFQSLTIQPFPNVPLELLLCKNPKGRFYAFHSSGYDFVLCKYPNRNGTFTVEEYEDHHQYQLNYAHLKKTRHTLVDLFQFVFQNVKTVSSSIRFQEFPLVETFLPKKNFVPEDEADMTLSSTRTMCKRQLLFQNIDTDLSCVYLNSNGRTQYICLYQNNALVDLSTFSFYRGWNETKILKAIASEKDMTLLRKLCLFYIQRFDLEITSTYLKIFWKYWNLRHPNDPDRCLSKIEQLYQQTNQKQNVLEWLLKYYQSQPKQSIPKQIFFIHIDQRRFEEYNYSCVHRCYQVMHERFKIILYNDSPPLQNPWWEKLQTQCPELEIRPLSRLDNFRGYPIHHVQYEADIHRMNILYENGGIYMDTDMYLLKPFDLLLDEPYQFMISKERPQEDGLINSILISSPQNGFLKLWQDYFDYGLRKNIWAYHIRETNRLLLEQRPYLMQKFGIKILEPKHFFPYTWEEHDKIMALSETTFQEQSDHFGIHLFETIKNDCLQRHPFLCPSSVNSLVN